jgi:hypothetical protein
MAKGKGKEKDKVEKPETKPRGQKVVKSRKKSSRKPSSDRPKG